MRLSAGSSARLGATWDGRGTNIGNVGEVSTLPGPAPQLNLTIPPLAAIFLVPES